MPDQIINVINTIFERCVLCLGYIVYDIEKNYSVYIKLQLLKKMNEIKEYWWLELCSRPDFHVYVIRELTLEEKIRICLDQAIVSGNKLITIIPSPNSCRPLIFVYQSQYEIHSSTGYCINVCLVLMYYLTYYVLYLTKEFSISMLLIVSQEMLDIILNLTTKIWRTDGQNRSE